MSQVKSSTFILGTAVLSVAILAMVWFLGASPALAEASLAKAETETASQRNAQLRAETAELEDEFARIGELEAELAGLRTQIPGDDGITAFNRYLGETAAQRGVTVVAITAAPAVQVLPLEAPAAAPADTAAPAEGAATAVPAEPEAVGNLYAVAVSVTVLGTYDNAAQFLDDLQRLNPRIFAVQTVNMTGQDAAEPAGGKPAIAQGDVEQIISGFVFVMPEDGLPPATGDAAAGTAVS